MSESINETNNATTPSTTTEDSFKGKVWKYTKMSVRIVGQAVVVGAIAGATSYVVMKTLFGECPVDIG